MKKRQIVLMVNNVRSSYNVGSILRTADGFGIDKVYLTGYTPYPETNQDKRLPHVAKHVSNQIKKTALGAEKTVIWQHIEHPMKVISQLKDSGYLVIALEQTPASSRLPDFKSDRDVAILVGNEVEGVEKELLKMADIYLEIPMGGLKESFNVAVATGIAIYHLKYVT